MVLGNRCKALVQQIFQAVVVGLHEKTAPPQVWPPVPHGVHKPDQLLLVGREGAVARRDGPAEEGDGVALLDEHRAEPMRRSVAFDGERLGEVRHGEDRR